MKTSKCNLSIACGIPLVAIMLAFPGSLPGNETRRAVTTVSGGTKLTVRGQVLTREGKVVFERTVNGDVRFFGSNLRATHNLAQNIAKTIKQSSWSRSGQPTAMLTGPT